MTATAAERPMRPTDRIIGIWLLLICTMVFAMVVLGGFTRLTESGLSMTDWRPVTGWLPPLDEAAWQAQFDAYRTSPEYNKVNAGMTLAEFQGIFWLEYLHRLFGRVIGVAFAVPALFFLVKGWLDRPLMVRLGVMFALGGLQGGIGWWMVKSGLVDHPDVSQYRLAIHLLMAFLILAIGLWFALDLLDGKAQPTAGRLRALSSVAVGMVFLTVFSGALVAGLNAGMSYNTFPLMAGQVFPDEGFAVSPWYLNFFEDIATVQFDHRVLAIFTVCVVAATWLAAQSAASAVRRRANVMMGMAFLQAGLGISTLLLVVPIPLAAAHQGGAVLLLASAVWLRHGVCRN